MAKGRKTGGRQKGSKNKATVDAEETLRRLGCNPLEGMALIAMGLHDIGPDKGKIATDITRDLRAKMMTELAQYIAPKRKAQEITGADGGPITTSWLPVPPK